ncbi:glycosyltransferase [Solibacillus sp. FSL W8-0474]|uniref:glycosyltransferase n=1 Tax=Solibacillus sp. FSL W8-0474 TaxID=2975336 RepID=UPI0030F86297
MNIAIDMLAVLGPGSKNRGIGNYTTSQLKSLLKQDKKNKYFLLNFYEDCNLKQLLNYGDNVTEHYYYLGPEEVLGKDERFSSIFESIIKKFLLENGIDVFYFTSPFDGLVSYNLEWFKDVQTVGTLYDIIPYIFKDRYLPNKDIKRTYMKQIENVLKMDKLLAISESAKNDLVNNFQYDGDNISVIYAGTDEWFIKKEITHDDIATIRDAYNIVDPFIICTGGDDDRKNIGDLIIAFSKLPDHLKGTYQLVVACKLSEVSQEKYYKLAEKHGVLNRVILTNFIPTAHLVLLYNLAHIVAFPSKYEGFGLPVVEGMACGTPVLTSNNSSLGEIAAGAAILVDPFDIKDITRGLVEILEQTNLEELIEKGYERLKLFQWDEVAAKSLQIFLTFDQKIKLKKIKKIAYFTPLPPIESGISDYSFDILRDLGKYVEVDVFIDDNYTTEILNDFNINVYSHKKFNNSYDEIIYQVGNSDFHEYMFEYIKTYSGIVVLHDFNLHALVDHLYNNKSKYHKYRNVLLEDYNNQSVENYIQDLAADIVAPQIYEMPTNGFVTNYAKKIIVHSDYSKKELLLKNINHDVVKIPHYAKIEPLVNKDEAKEKLSIDVNSIVLSTFGIIHDTKRIIPLLMAFKELVGKNKNLRLCLVGKPTDTFQQPLSTFLKENKLEEFVTITGYTELDEFENYMDATDIALNLRYPYNGETSGSLMRLLAKGKCIIVNNLGSFSEIPDKCIVKLPSPENLTEQEEVNKIVQAIESLLNNFGEINNYEIEARKYSKTNLDLKIIIQQYLECLNYKVKTTITEEQINELANFIKDNKGINNLEIFNISKTLAYLK